MRSIQLFTEIYCFERKRSRDFQTGLPRKNQSGIQLELFRSLLWYGGN